MLTAPKLGDDGVHPGRPCSGSRGGVTWSWTGGGDLVERRAALLGYDGIAVDFDGWSPPVGEELKESRTVS